MRKAEFIAICPFELEDKVKLILDKEKSTYSESIYSVSDIQTTHSIKTGIVSFKIILKDEFDRDLLPRDIEDLILIN